MPPSPPVTPPLTRGSGVLAAAFLASGVVHLVRPRVFEPAVPPQLPQPRQLVIWSGAAEIVCGLGMLVPQTRRLAGLASAALLLGVWPANVQMLVSAHGRARRHPRSWAAQVERVVTAVRVPLQVPLICIALRAAGR
ncbi:MAG: DoxX family protein [Actinomycetota bacterium]|nr:DoxX family protein [Actinomycetota bacterium]